MSISTPPRGAGWARKVSAASGEGVENNATIGVSPLFLYNINANLIGGKRLLLTIEIPESLALLDFFPQKTPPKS